MQQPYVLGHSEAELQRLEQQGSYLRPLTRDLLVRAGIAPGMRVLDFGTGAGDVAILAAELVGPSGEVVAIDRASEAIDRVRARAEARGLRNVHAVASDENGVADLARERAFDAVAGRLVLLHQRDPMATLIGLLRHVRPGGVVAFQEMDLEAGHWSEPQFPTLKRSFDWVLGAFTRAGMCTNIGRTLVGGLGQAGLVGSRVVREGIMESGAESNAFEFIAQTVRTLLPAIVRTGLATEDEVQIDTLAERLRAEATATGLHFIPCFVVSATGRVPA